MGRREIKMVISIYLASILGLGVIGVASKYNLIGRGSAQASVQVTTAPAFPTTPMR
jgi:hypothetical protein